MRRTVRMARDAGVAVGAHPGLPDLVGFGRREMRVTPAEVEDMVLYQVGRFAHRLGRRRDAAARQGARRALQHGGQGRGLAEAIARAVRAVDPG